MNARTLLFLALLACGNKPDSNAPSTGTAPTGTTPATGSGTGSGTGTGTGSTTTSTPCDLTEVPPVTGDPLTVPLAGECAMDVRNGGFRVAHYTYFSSVEGTVSDGVVPNEILTEEVVDGDCRLLRKENPFCTPACEPNETCDFDGSCIPYPTPQNLGAVTVGGLPTGVRMTPRQPGNNYFDTSVAHPPVDAGTLLELQTGCVSWDAVTLHGVGVEPIVVPDPNWVVREGQDLAIAWTPPTVATNPGQHLRVRMTIDQHGVTPLQMVCDFPDTGTATLPSALIDTMINDHVSGFPNASVSRRTVDSTDLSGGGGCMQFEVLSQVDLAISVDGFIPCNPGPSTNCPTGTTCNPLTYLCE